MQGLARQNAAEWGNPRNLDATRNRRNPKPVVVVVLLPQIVEAGHGSLKMPATKNMGIPACQPSLMARTCYWYMNWSSIAKTGVK
jgi:hypothetical protein